MVNTARLGVSHYGLRGKPTTMDGLEITYKTGVWPETIHATTCQLMKQILVIDDDPSIRNMLNRYLSQEGYSVRTGSNSVTMNRLMSKHSFDLVILDLMLAGEDGLVLAKQIRKTTDVPIIMLTIKGDEIDRIIGFEIGADDYIPKPFNPRELLARMKSVLRRADKSRPAGTNPLETRQVAHFANWRLNLVERELRSDANTPIALTTGEFSLLSIFVIHPNRVLSRVQLLDYINEGKRYPFDRSIDIQVMRLRRKIEKKPKIPAIIKTVRGTGYLFKPKVEWS